MSYQRGTSHRSCTGSGCRTRRSDRWRTGRCTGTSATSSRTSRRHHHLVHQQRAGVSELGTASDLPAHQTLTTPRLTLAAVRVGQAQALLAVAPERVVVPGDSTKQRRARSSATVHTTTRKDNPEPGHQPGTPIPMQSTTPLTSARCSGSSRSACSTHPVGPHSP